MVFKAFLISVILTCGCWTMLSAQRPIPNTGTQGAQTGQDRNASVFQDQEGFDDRDTFGVFYFYADNPNLETPFADTTLGNYFHQYDPARRRLLDYMTLGILGSAAQPVVYQPTLRKGFSVGLNQYDLYLTTTGEMPYYRLEKPYTNASYTQGTEQADGFFTARFSRNFANGLNFTLAHDRISQLGTLDQYPNQNTRNTLLTTGMWYHSLKGNYDGFFGVAANTIEQEDNGGVFEPPIQEGQFASPSTAQVYLENGQTRHTHRELSYTHYYKFGGRPDSLRGATRAFTLSHQALLNTSTYKFFDVATSGDTLFYNRFPLFQGDLRGARFFLRHRNLQNSFTLSTFKLSKTRSENEARDLRDLIQVGISHSNHKLEYEPTDSVINNLFLTGRINFNPSPGFRINTYAHLGLWDNAGDYRLSGELFLDLKKAGMLYVRANNQLYRPTLVQDQLFLSQRQFWNNSFKSTLETNLQASYRLPQLDLEISGGYHLINQLIYFDTSGFPVQTGLPVSITQLIIRKNFQVWHLHLDNVVALQQTTEDFIRLPTIYSTHSFYYEGQWFGVLHVRLGADLRYNTSYFADYYNPFTGQFQLQNRREINAYPNLDGFFSMRVTKFRAFFKYENITSMLGDRGLYYQTAFYPFPDGAVRIGINWRFVN